MPRLIVAFDPTGTLEVPRIHAEERRIRSAQIDVEPNLTPAAIRDLAERLARMLLEQLI